ncbi:RNA polymerase Rpc34, partial [Nadsonia fulvescens var. elongata DSM 6958]
LSDQAAELHLQMLKSRSLGHLYLQQELAQLCENKDNGDMMVILQELISVMLVRPAKQGDELGFLVVTYEKAAKLRSMSGDDAMIYLRIEEAGREGIWTKTLKAKTNLHQTVVLRGLKQLESQNYIKCVKSVKHPTRKIYMLFELQPSTDLTGGPWFTDSEIDTEFIDSLLNIIWRYVCSLSFPNAFGEHYNQTQESYTSSYGGYPTCLQIHKFVQESGITNVELDSSHVRNLCEVLVHDDKLERRDGGVTYRATWKSFVEAG